MHSAHAWHGHAVAWRPKKMPGQLRGLWTAGKKCAPILAIPRPPATSLPPLRAQAHLSLSPRSRSLSPRSRSFSLQTSQHHVTNWRFPSPTSACSPPETRAAGTLPHTHTSLAPVCHVCRHALPATLPRQQALRCHPLLLRGIKPHATPPASPPFPAAVFLPPILAVPAALALPVTLCPLPVTLRRLACLALPAPQ